MDQFLPLIQQSTTYSLQEITQALEGAQQFNLSLTAQEKEALILSRNNSLTTHRRLELSDTILPTIIQRFSSSQYINNDNYLDHLMRLTDMFYHFKNATMDLVTDIELINFMEEQFNNVCYGDLDYLESTCLERFAKAVRSGKDNYQSTEGRNLYEDLSEEKRWDADLYQDVLKELFW